MWTDAIDLRDFYACPLGRVARRMIGRRLRLLWPDLRGQRVLGLGYAIPFLAPLVGEAERVLAMMPAAQGVLHWPADGLGLTALVDETNLPLADRSIDRILVVHALECAERTRPLMRETWRVLSDGGRLIVVVPNRRGLWAQFERTPFGHGRPYSRAQLARTLREAMFTPYQTANSLFVPPVHSKMMLSAAGAWEEVGERWFPTFSGVIVCEASKQIYAGHVAYPRTISRVYAPVPTSW